MQLQKQPNNVTCLPASFAMCCEMPVEKILEAVGHNGLMKVSDERWPLNYRAFHPQEVMDILPYHFQTIDCAPDLLIVEGKTFRVFEEDYEQSRLQTWLENHDGVLVGSFRDTGHAMAWSHKEESIFDPAGKIYKLKEFVELDFTTRTFYARIDSLTKTTLPNGGSKIYVPRT